VISNIFNTVVAAISAKPTLGVLSIAISVIAYGIYLWQTTKEEGIRPHPLSWLLWGFVTAVATVAQWAKGAGPGYWVTAFTAIACFIIGVLTLRKYKHQFSRLDWIALILGIAAVFWFAFEKNPTAAAVLATIADVLGYYSTVKKGWHYPYSDSPICFALNSIKFIPALFALDAYSVATWLYPATIVIVNGGVAIMLFLRQKALSSAPHTA
jgi:hypothetical protein